MLPTASTTRVLLRIVTAVDVAIYVNVSIDVDIHIATVPVASAPSITPGGAYGNPHSEGKKRCSYHISRGIVVIGWIRRIRPCTVDDSGIICGHINDLRISWLYDNRLLVHYHLLLR